MSEFNEYRSRETVRARKVTEDDGEQVIGPAGPGHAAQGTYIVERDSHGQDNDGNTVVTFTAVEVWGADEFDAIYVDDDADKQDDDADDDDDDDGPGNYEDWTVKELVAEITGRNENRVDTEIIDVDPPGNKAELVAALEADDE